LGNWKAWVLVRRAMAGTPRFIAASKRFIRPFAEAGEHDDGMGGIERFRIAEAGAGVRIDETVR
jgi:hypothetical protein